ncbi:hypothetical protein SCALM49S_07461 [Streptomyces californicus]
MTTPLLLLAAAFLLILADGFFVAAEFGLVTVDRPDAERAAAEGDRRARTVVHALRELSFQLSRTQLGITLTSLVVGMLAEPALAQLLACTSPPPPGSPRAPCPASASSSACCWPRPSRWSSANSCPRTGRSPGRSRWPASSPDRRPASPPCCAR